MKGWRVVIRGGTMLSRRLLLATLASPAFSAFPPFPRPRRAGTATFFCAEFEQVTEIYRQFQEAMLRKDPLLYGLQLRRYPSSGAEFDQWVMRAFVRPDAVLLYVGIWLPPVHPLQYDWTCTRPNTQITWGQSPKQVSSEHFRKEATA